MQFITCHSGKLQALLAGQLPLSQGGGSFRSGLPDLDALAPGQSFARAAVHELLSPIRRFTSLTLAFHLARSAATDEREIRQPAKRPFPRAGYQIGNPAIEPAKPENPSHSPLLFLDPAGTLYPPALSARFGLDLSRFYLLRPRTRDQALWAAAECLRCPGVGAVVAAVESLSRIEARRLQLAAEAGGTVGILLRPHGPKSSIYAAATRWLVQPAPGHRTVQRWRIQLLHGHGGRVGQSVYVDDLRETNTLRATPPLADRPSLPATEARSA